MNPYQCARYRVEWRPRLTNNWQLIETVNDRVLALERAQQALTDFEGQVRVVSQEVTRAEGLGAHAFEVVW